MRSASTRAWLRIQSGISALEQGRIGMFPHMRKDGRLSDMPKPTRDAVAASAVALGTDERDSTTLGR